ncbi:hypothetical protein BDQ12DRAFT_259298 [Crucibulum laeve]|uniref:F-box domain-containing protein n=1 Tax=Crucibulum laeve TaxID=68775 RepID=A0A5C3M4S5_9AGAR|nr:hypothetical protein BDQ12DRAFT_259298 [Crucibulum laeve]
MMPLSMHFYMNEIRGCLFRLSSLHLSATKIDVQLNIEELAPLACYSSVPRLSTIKTSEPFIPKFLTLPWEQITFWEGTTDERTWFDMLEKTPNLRTCSFTKVYTLGHQDPIFTRPLPILKYLEVLDLTQDLRSSSFPLETMPVLPSLKCLRVTSDDISGFSQEGLASFLSKNGLGIETLKLCIRDTAKEDLVSWLNHTPTVTELDIDSSSCIARPVNDRFLGELVCRLGQSSCMIPKLKLLRLKGDILFFDHAFLLMIYSRWRPFSTEETINGTTSRLQTVHIICSHWVRMNADLTARLPSLRNQSLRAMIQS